MYIMNYHDELQVQFTRGAELVNRPGVSPARSPVHPCSSQRPRRLFARTIDSMTLEKWERITNIPLFILSAVFLFAYSWQILAQTHLQGIVVFPSAAVDIDAATNFYVRPSWILHVHHELP